MWCLQSLPAFALASLHLPVQPYSSKKLPPPSYPFPLPLDLLSPNQCQYLTFQLPMSPAVGIASLQH